MTYNNTPPTAIFEHGLPEVYRPSDPEVYRPEQHPRSAQFLHPSAASLRDMTAEPKHNPEYSSPSTFAELRKRAVCGCSALILILSIIIGILFAAVIGLAAGVGIAASKYNTASSSLPALTNSSGTGGANYANLTSGCSNKDESITGTTYTSRFFSKNNFTATYTRYCNRRAANDHFFSLFATDFEGCIEACIGWNYYRNGTNATCQAVTFIPKWTNKDTALADRAWGDCFLQPGPQLISNLRKNEFESHAAIRDG